MGLTQVSTDGVKNDAINTAKINNGSIQSEDIADNQIITTKILDGAVSLAKLPHGDSNNNGKFLRANNGADPTFETITVPASINNLVEDTSPQLGGALDSNGNNINMGDGDELRIGDSADLQLYHASNNSHIKNDTNALIIRSDALRCNNNGNTETMIKADANGAVELYFNNEKTLHTKENGVVVEGGQGDNAILELRADQGDDNADYFRLHNDGGFLSFQNYGSGSWQTLLSLQQQNQVRLFYNGSEKLNTTNTGIAISGKIYMNNGNLQFGASGNGIDFSATSDAGGMSSEVLDDYEEGTFTPNWDGAGGVTFSYNHQFGWYTKIGNTVTFQLYIQGYASTITSGNENNALALQGLPFTILNHSRYYPSFTIGRTYKFDIEAAERLYAYGDPNTTQSRFIKESDDAAGSLLVAQDLNQNTTVVHLSGVYRTDA